MEESRRRADEPEMSPAASFTPSSAGQADRFPATGSVRRTAAPARGAGGRADRGAGGRARGGGRIVARRLGLVAQRRILRLTRRAGCARERCFQAIIHGGETTGPMLRSEVGARVVAPG